MVRVTDSQPPPSPSSPAANDAPATATLRLTVPARTLGLDADAPGTFDAPSANGGAPVRVGSVSLCPGRVSLLVYSAAEHLHGVLADFVRPAPGSEAEAEEERAAVEAAASYPVIDGIVEALCHPAHAPPGFSAAVVPAPVAAATPASSISAASNALPPAAAAQPASAASQEVTVVVVPVGAYPSQLHETVEAAFSFASLMAPGRRRVAELCHPSARVEHVLSLTGLAPFRRARLAALPPGTWQHTAAALGVELCGLPVSPPGHFRTAGLEVVLVRRRRRREGGVRLGLLAHSISRAAPGSLRWPLRRRRARAV